MLHKKRESTFVIPNQMTSTFYLADKHKQREVSNLFYHDAIFLHLEKNVILNMLKVHGI